MKTNTHENVIGQDETEVTIEKGCRALSAVGDHTRQTSGRSKGSGKLPGRAWASHGSGGF